MIRQSDLTHDIYRIGQVADLLGVSITTIHYLMKDGELNFYTLPNSKHRRIKKEHLIEYLTKKDMFLDDTEKDRQDIIYVRVSTHQQKTRGDLERQQQTVTNYVIDKNPKNLQVISDVASGLNDNRKGLNQLIQLILDNKVDRIFIHYKDHLTHFGFNYLKQLCDYHQTEIIIVSDETIDKS